MSYYFYVFSFTLQLIYGHDSRELFVFVTRGVYFYFSSYFIWYLLPIINLFSMLTSDVLIIMFSVIDILLVVGPLNHLIKGNEVVIRPFSFIKVRSCFIIALTY